MPSALSESPASSRKFLPWPALDRAASNYAPARLRIAGREPVGADNAVAVVDLVFFRSFERPELEIWLRESPSIRHLQYSCHYDSLI
jgi:hypothetical protein